MTDSNDRSSRSDQTEIEIPDFGSEPDHIQFRERETVRNRLADRMLLLIAAISLTLIGGVIVKQLNYEVAKDLAATFLQPLLGIFVGIVAFFFGERRSR